MDDLLALQVHPGDPTLVVLNGEVDASNASCLARALVAATSHLELDCQGLRFGDASFLRALLEAQRELSSRGLSLVLGKVSPQVSRLIELAELADVLGLAESIGSPE